MKQPKVSVIVPVYNVEKYLEECLDSIFAQTLEEMEIICVDDGSTDRSPEILKRYAAGNPHMRVITKKNTGYGDTMNTGIRAAEGNYIGIVESDDFIEPEMFEKLCRTADKYKADVVKSNFWLYWSEPEKNELYEYFQRYECRKVIHPLIWEEGSLFGRKPSIWSAIYRKEFLEKNGIEFLPTPGASFQDTSFTFKVYSLAERMVCLPNAFLHYRQDNGASSVNNVEKKINSVLEEYEEIGAFLKERGEEELAEMVPVYAAAFYDCCIWTYENMKSYQKRYEFLKLVQPRFKEILKELEPDEIAFRGMYWKERDIVRIAEDPFEYHMWRNVERFEQEGGKTYDTEPLTPPGNAKLIEAERKADTEKSEAPFFSVILPCCNVEKYLASSIESVLFQTFTDFEAVCVNDGSTDHTLNLLEEYAASDSRVVVINKKNEGLAAARNTGAAAARGAYLVFLDSDDYLSEDALEILHRRLEGREEINAVLYGAAPFPEEPAPNEWLVSVLKTPDYFYREVGAELFLTNPFMRIFAWRCCVKRTFLTGHGICFPGEMRWGEDAVYMADLMCKMKNMLSISDVLYHYRHFNPSSLTAVHTQNPVERAQKQLVILEETLATLENNGTEPSAELFDYCMDFVYSAVDGCPMPEKRKVVRRLVGLMKKKKLNCYMSECKPQVRGFWQYCIGLKKSRSGFFRMSGKAKLSWKKFVPPSRENFWYTYGVTKALLEENREEMRRQQEQLNRLQAQQERCVRMLEGMAARERVNDLKER